MEETPRKTFEEGEQKQPQETGVKPGEESQYHPAESHYEQEEQEEAYEKEHTIDETLDHIQGDIRQLGDRLAAISQEKLKHQDGSEQYERLEDERRVLRKEIIDLDYHHKITIIKRRKQKEQAEPSAPPAPAEEQKKEEEGQPEGNVAEARYNARIREIQSELAASRLRRSRQIQLEADLISIRSLTPYYWWRYYDRPYYYCPLSYPYYPPSLSYPYSLYYPYGPLL